MGTCKIQYNGSIVSEVEETGDVLVKYNDVVIKTFDGSVVGESSVTLPCNKKYMAGNITVGSKTLNCNKKMMASDIVITVNNPKTGVHIFDSSRSDNFIFGSYIYTMPSGSMTTSSTSWPHQADTENIANKIILTGIASGLLTSGYNACLKIYPNNVAGTWGDTYYAKNVFFMNNVSYDGASAGTRGIGVPGETMTLFVKGYRTKTSGSPTIAYKNTSGNTINSTTVTATSMTTYSLDITFVSGGYIELSAVKGCGDFIITDIWLE